MIFNKTGGGQKKYKITNAGFLDSVPESAYPGEYVSCIARTSELQIQGNSSGNTVPVALGTPNEISVQMLIKKHNFYFVMPAEDVTIS